MVKRKKVLVIGGGPAGIMAAIACKTYHSNYDVTIIERNSSLGKKLCLTGGGRCNVTALVDNETVIKNTIQNGKFLYSSLTDFNTTDIYHFFEERNCLLQVEERYRVFPASNQAESIVNVLLAEIKKLNIEVKYECYIEDIQKLKYDHLILATGGNSYWQTGSDGTGYLLAKQLGHTITDLAPAEVALVSNDAVIQSKKLQGLSFNDVKITIGKKMLTHDLIITHFGLSGPLALGVSSNLNFFPTEISIDFLPNLSWDSIKNDKKQLEVLPKRLLRYIKEETSSEDELISKIKAFPLTIHDTKGFSSAFVTKGGVSIKELDPKTMKSKKDPQLSFCGEVLDLNAYTGGYNMTIALVTGYCAGKNV